MKRMNGRQLLKPCRATSSINISKFNFICLFDRNNAQLLTCNRVSSAYLHLLTETTSPCFCLPQWHPHLLQKPLERLPCPSSACSKIIFNKAEKCNIRAESVSLFGFIISNVIHQAGLATTPTFLGSQIFTEGLLKNYSQIASPLTQLTSTSILFSWTQMPTQPPVN